MAFLFQDQNQGIRNDEPRAMRLSRPFSFIRTMTVGFGFTPNLLTLFLRFPEEEGARGLGLLRLYRRWGLSPRPENIGCPVLGNLTGTMTNGRGASKRLPIGNPHVPMPPARDCGRGPGSAKRRKLTIGTGQSDSP